MTPLPRLIKLSCLGSHAGRSRELEEPTTGMQKTPLPSTVYDDILMGCQHHAASSTIKHLIVETKSKQQKEMPSEKDVEIPSYLLANNNRL